MQCSVQRYHEVKLLRAQSYRMSLISVYYTGCPRKLSTLSVYQHLVYIHISQANLNHLNKIGVFFKNYRWWWWYAGGKRSTKFNVISRQRESICLLLEIIYFSAFAFMNKFIFKWWAPTLSLSIFLLHTFSKLFPECSKTLTIFQFWMIDKSAAVFQTMTFFNPSSQQ